MQLRIDDSTSYSNCIFDQPWWLNAASPGGWDCVELKRRGETIGRWPFIMSRQYGMTVLTMPPYTQVLGPWIAACEGKYTRQLERQKELLSELVNMLPRFDYFSQCFHFSVTNWLPLYWQNWSQTTRYTYILSDLSDQEKVWQELSVDARREIRRGEKSLKVSDDASLDEVISLQHMSYARQKRKSPPDDILRRIGEACALRGAGKAFVARDAQGRPHAGIYVVWDDKSAYYLVGGGDPDLRNSGANSLLIWKAIQFAAQRGLAFDFEGSMVESIERFFRSFGARLVPYSKVSKARSKLARTAVVIRELIRS